MIARPVTLARCGIALAFALAANAVAADRLAAQDTAASHPVAGTSITLQEAIRFALAQDITLRFARNAAALDSLGVREARNQFFPNLSVSSQTSQGFGAGSQGQNALASSLGASSGLTLYNGGQNTNTLRQAQLILQAGGRDLGRTTQTVVFNVATDFLNLMTQQEQMGVQQENLAAQQQELTQLEAFTTAGTRPIGDLYQQQAAVAATRLALANASHATEVAKVDLIQELLLDPRGTYTFTTPKLRTAADSAATFNLDSLITVALAQRADLQAQTLRVEAAKRVVLIAEGGRFPVVTANGGYSSGFNSTADGTFANQLDQRRGGSVGVGIALPIFDRGAVSIARQRAQIELENETLTLRDLQQSVALQVRRAYIDYQAAQEQLIEATAQQTAAALALEASQARYRSGVATFVEVTVARATLIQAQSAVVTARSTLAFQQATMSYFTGVLGPNNARPNRQ